MGDHYEVGMEGNTHRSSSVGSCRRLEKSLLGTYRFRDFSKEQSTRAGLTAEMVREVNEHFGIMIHDCLMAEAQRRPTTEETYHLYWTVLNDGRVNQVHFETPERGTGLLADCIRSQFALWRYPRYRGEWQNVDQTFVVKARETRIAAESPQ